MDGKPCTMCKAGKRMAKKGSYTRDDFARNVMDHLHALEEADAKGKGKLRALCPGCGAKQNKKHVHCTECGQQLPPMPPMVAKNHDFHVPRLRHTTWTRARSSARSAARPTPATTRWPT